MDQFLVYFLLSLPLIGAFAMFSLGIVVIYQSSRVLNLAHGAMAMIPAYLAYEMSRLDVPMFFVLELSIASGVVLGLLVERLFVRGLRRQGSTGQTVGTVAALGLLVAIAVRIWGTTPRTGVSVFPGGGVAVGASTLRWGQIGLFVVAVAAAAIFFAIFRFTELGLSMRGAADNRRAASLMGINPNATTAVAWGLGGGLAAVAGILLAAVTTLHPINLTLLVLPGFVAALIGGLQSLPGALAGAGAVGLAFGMVPALGQIPGLRVFATQVGAPQLVLTIVALVVMARRGQRFALAETEASPMQSTPDDAGARAPRSGGSPRRGAVLGILVILALTWPFLGVPSALVGTGIQAFLLFVVAASLVLLTGWVGQISLAQATFVGIGAFVTATLSERLGIPFPFNLPIAGLVAAGAAAALGLVALRVRGLYLAVATLIFAWMADEYLFRSAWLVGSGGSASLIEKPIGTTGAVPSFDLSDRTAFYYIALAVAAAVLWAVANLRDSKTGRAFFAVRGSETAAASLGIDITRYKLLAFAAAGLLAGVAGNLLIVSRGAAVPAQFVFTQSLFFLAVVVVGGLRSLGGAIGAAVVFSGLEYVFFEVEALAGWLEVVGTGLLALVLLAYPGGLAALPQGLKRGRVRLAELNRRLSGSMPRIGPALELATAGAPAVVADEERTMGRAVLNFLARLDRQLSGREPWRRRDRELAAVARAQREEQIRAHVRRAAMEVSEPEAVAVSGAGNGEPQSRAARRPRVDRRVAPVLLEVEGVTVRFGGLTAVEGVSLSVHEGEIVGLIGPNGAGKTTIFNAISGLNEPAEGTVRLFGRDASDLPVHRRAALGVARTFQVVQLFGELTVFDNLLAATHLQNDSGAMEHVVVTRGALAGEDSARTRVREVVSMLGLEPYSERPITGLPFGVLRMVELARAIVTGAPLILLDEPASGLDNRETDRLAELMFFVRAEMGVSMLLIEHDVRMVTSVSDYMYVIDQGRPLAEGPPERMRRDPAVMAAYLGTDASAEPVPARELIHA